MQNLRDRIKVKPNHLFVALAVVYAVVENLVSGGNVEREQGEQFQKLPDFTDEDFVVGWMSDLVRAYGTDEGKLAAKMYAVKGTSKKALRAATLVFMALDHLRTVYGLRFSGRPLVNVSTSGIAVRLKGDNLRKNGYFDDPDVSSDIHIYTHVSLRKLRISISSSYANRFQVDFDFSPGNEEVRAYNVQGTVDERLLNAAVAGAKMCAQHELGEIWLEDEERTHYATDYIQFMAEFTHFVTRLIG